ncbi:Sfi1 spindle body protein-domain-containing protein [Ampelomyces quisqualis]|uniref:Sfi1 spindle body protein-domain-containing protein n=1 Tax=Ampelomyces quisqualis TaxID=50730 RepID=A0A6A5QVU0_AMPQU|nr:Sfi1 spindle body protein-domain-containing protein [Ampelomyces quisqualis]
MPPPMSPNGDDTIDALRDGLTDRAIETLYDIIRRAQATSQEGSRAQPTSPSFNALFSAYNDVLGEQGLRPSDDAILHRFLFRMQEHRRDNEDIVQRFQRVLGDLNIQIEVDEEGEGVEVTANLDKPRDQTRNGAVAALGRHSRRSSFDSFFDGTADKVPGTAHGDVPLRIRSRSNAGTHGGHRSQRRVRSDTEAHSYQQLQIPIRSRPKRSASVSSRGSLQIRRDAPIGTARTGHYDADDSDQTDRTTSLDLSHIQVPGINAPIPKTSHASTHQQQPYVPEPFRPSDTRLFDDAETFEEQRLHRVTRGCIQTWRNRTQERLPIREDMRRLAVAFDRRILLKLSFEQLRDTARMRQSARETERFFGRLEERADRARNIFLLTKAFTHWAKSAEDEVQRTSVARRHILRTRFFNGWRDITAVNELKVQHFVLAKFLRQWRARTAAVRVSAQSAVELYEENLVRRIYRQWFFQFCAIAAPAWRNDRTRKITLHKMSEIAKVFRERQEWAVDRWERGILRKTLQHWHGETTTIQALAPRANDFRRTALLSSGLQALRKRAQSGPLLRQFQEHVSGRVVRSVFRQWRNVSQLSRQASDVNQMRIMRNAYTAWNDRLRIKALEDRINDRIIIEALYRWTLASRVSLFQRVHDRQLKESTFLAWVTKANQRANTLDAAERRFTHFKRAQLLRTCLRKMEIITTEKRAEEFAVVAEFQQKLKQRTFDTLKERQAHFQQLGKWADAAQYYVLSKNTLKTWSAATQHSRRNRRRDTYAQVRRTVKTNLVRRLFANWRDMSSHIAHLNQQAKDVLENRTSHSSVSLLHRWHDRTITLRQLDTQASNFIAFKLEMRYIRTWSGRMDLLQTMDHQAVALRQEGAELAATTALKKLGWRLWNIQRQEENGRALYERNFEKHVRAMVRFWVEQMNERLANRPVSPTPASRSRRSRRDDDDRDRGGRPDVRDEEDDGPSGFDDGGEQTKDLETWSAFDSNALGLNDDLDLSLSITPDQQRTRQPPSSSRPQPHRSILRPTPARPNMFPPPHSALRPPPQTIPEDSILDPAFAADLDRDLADPSAFWSSNTPLPSVSTLGRPGYLKTPSKRSVVRAKRPELPASPEKRERVLSPVRRSLGALSAPPERWGGAGFGGAAERGVTSFQRRLRAGGFGRSLAPLQKGGKGKGRVGFGDVSHME